MIGDARVTAQSARKTTTPRKAAPRKVAAPARTAGAPAAVVEETAVAGAVVPRPSSSRAAAKAAAALRGTPPESTPAPDVPVPDPDGRDADTAELEFVGRRVLVKLPTAEQLTIYRRLSREFQDLSRDGAADRLSLDEALRHLGRATRLVQSILAEDRDREWLEDQLLDGKITMQQCTGLLRDAFKRLNAKAEAQAAGANRATRRRARLAED